jgi:hypothetical protein
MNYTGDVFCYCQLLPLFQRETGDREVNFALRAKESSKMEEETKDIEAPEATRVGQKGDDLSADDTKSLNTASK